MSKNRTSILCFLFSASLFCFAQGQEQSEISFTGTIGSDLKIQMKLKFEENQVSGTYSYDEFRSDIPLKGSIENGEDLTLNEFDTSGNTIGIFKGTLVSSTSIEGIWSEPDSSNKLPFVIEVKENLKFINNPVDEYIKNNGLESNTDTTDNLVRIETNFDNDGYVDIAVINTGTWGASSGGGEWEIYLATDHGKYFFLNRLFFHPYAILSEALEKGIGQLRLYHRIDANQGYLYEFKVTRFCVWKINERIMDMRKDEDEAEYQKLFGDLRINKISEFCKLTNYLKNKNCVWHKGYY